MKAQTELGNTGVPTHPQEKEKEPSGCLTAFLWVIGLIVLWIGFGALTLSLLSKKSFVENSIAQIMRVDPVLLADNIMGDFYATSGLERMNAMEQQELQNLMELYQAGQFDKLEEEIPGFSEEMVEQMGLPDFDELDNQDYQQVLAAVMVAEYYDMTLYQILEEMEVEDSEEIRDNMGRFGNLMDMSLAGINRLSNRVAFIAVSIGIMILLLLAYLSRRLGRLAAPGSLLLIAAGPGYISSLRFSYFLNRIPNEETRQILEPLFQNLISVYKTVYTIPLIVGGALLLSSILVSLIKKNQKMAEIRPQDK